MIKFLLRFKIRLLIKLYNKLFKKKHRTILVWSEDTCRIDEKGGPYEVKVNGKIN